MSINLAPYNYWVLYAALVILLITLVVSIVKSLKALKQLSFLQPELESINRETTMMKIKSDVIHEKTVTIVSKLAVVFMVVPIVMEISRRYKNNGVQGADGIRLAAKQYFDERAQTQKIVKEVVKVIKK